jgi:hypothetical protein
VTPQSNFMIVAPIEPGHVGLLRALLKTMTTTPGIADPNNALFPFGHYERVHFARFVILEDHTLSDLAELGLPIPEYPLALAFFGDCDGSADALLKEFATKSRPGLEKIFSHCGFDPFTDLYAWMQAHAYTPAAAYVNMRGRTVKQILEEKALRAKLSTYIRENSPRLLQASPRDVRAELQEHVADFLPTRPQRTPPGWWLTNALHFLILPGLLALPWILAVPFLLPLPPPFFAIVIPSLIVSLIVFLWLILHAAAVFALLVALGLMLVAFLALLCVLCWPLLAPPALVLVLFLWILRLHEKGEPEIIHKPTDAQNCALARLEDHDVTNGFTLVGSVKPGGFRLGLLRVSLWIIDWFARHVYVSGYLARIQTIHFARWVFIDGHKRAVFGSNYDGNLDSYNDDFINKVGFGLNLAFGSAVGYPRTRWIIFDGAADEQKFKYTLRRHQIPTDVWYCAYPGLTAFDLARNARVRKGIELGFMSDRAIRAWLSDL